MSFSIPNDIFHNAFQRFSYNIDLIEKRYKNKRPSGLEMDCDTGKIIQVIDSKRPRLTVEEAKEKMKTSFLAPSSLLGNSSLCSPFVDDMTASKETKLRVLKHNKRFKNLVNKGTDCSTFLNDENGNGDEACEYNEIDENREEEELFDLDDVLDDDDGDEEGAEDDDDGLSENDEEETLVDNDLSEDDDIGPSNEQDKELEDELDKEKENDEFPFEEPEEEATKEENTYKNLKITRALLQRLTPKVSRMKNIAKPLSSASKKNAPLTNNTPKAQPRRRTTNAPVLKERNEIAEGTPKVMQRRTIGSAMKKTPTVSKKKITKSASAKAVPKTPSVTKKVPKAASEEAVSKKDDNPLVEQTPKKVRGRPRKSLIDADPSNVVTPVTSSGKKTTTTASEKSTSKKKAAVVATPKSEAASSKKITKPASEKSTTKKKASVFEEKTPTSKKTTKPASTKAESKTPTVPKMNTKSAHPLTVAVPTKKPGRQRKSLPMTEAAAVPEAPKARGRPRKSIA